MEKKKEKNVAEMTNEEKKHIVEDFVLSREILSELDPYLNEINLFEILKSKQHELRHSNILAWLLDPKGSHGIGDAFTRLFISQVIKKNTQLNYDILKWSYLDLSSCDIQREKKWPSTGKKDSLDIYLTAYQTNGPDYLIAIENKVGSSESQGQTKKYRENIEKENHDAEKMFVFLSAKDDVPDDDKWATLSYDSIIDMLDFVLKTPRLSPEVDLIINNYRKVCAEIMDMQDEELRNVVKKIYREHKRAIDLIIEYKPDLQQDIADYLGEKLIQLRKDSEEAQISIEQDINIQKSRVRFKTSKMNQFIEPFDDKLSCWNSVDNYNYEFSFPPMKEETLKVSFTLVLNVKNLDKSGETYQNGDKLQKLTNYSGKKTEKKGSRVALQPILSEVYSLDIDLDDDIKRELDTYFDKVIKAIIALEQKLPIS